MRILGVSLVTTTCLICGALLSTAAYAAGQPVEQIALSLTREYGRAIYRDCRLDITIFEGQGRAGWQCTLNREPPKSVRAERALTPQEVRAYSDLLRTVDLCGGGHMGIDGRAGDGVLETLTTRCSEGSVAILVTSGNPTFNTNESRRQLLDRLHSLEEELRKSATPPR